MSARRPRWLRRRRKRRALRRLTNRLSALPLQARLLLLTLMPEEVR